MKLSLLGLWALNACSVAILLPLHSATQEVHAVYHADYVVVGMGAAGAGVAKLLSDDPRNSVIGLEAGKNQDQHTPIKNSTMANSLESGYYATFFYQQEQLPEAFNGMQYHYTTGFLMGGGSSINGEQYVQGTNANYQRWENLLGSTWSVKKIRAAFKAFEEYNGSTNNRPARGFHGTVDIRQTPKIPSAMAQKFVNAVASATSFPEILDYNDPQTPLGPFTRWQLYQKPNGNRENSSTAYLKDIVNKEGESINSRKLTILPKSSALRILFDRNKKAIGVEFLQGGKFSKVFAKKKIILCTGVFSPKLLMLSGIGSKYLLRSKGINPIFHNPQVGQNLVNHPMITTVFTANTQDAGVPADDQNALYVGGAFLPNPTQGSDQTKRDIQLIGMSQSPGSFTVTTLLLNPNSRGHVKIQSNDPIKPVLATDAILINSDDLTSFMNSFKIYIKNIAEQLAIIDPTYQLVSPSLAIINDDDLLTDFIKENVGIPHHWMSSCRMAPRDQGGVVDKYGHVYGVKNLVIADTSISPYPNDGNTSAPAFMIGRMIAKQILDNEKN